MTSMPDTTITVPFGPDDHAAVMRIARRSRYKGPDGPGRWVVDVVRRELRRRRMAESRDRRWWTTVTLDGGTVRQDGVEVATMSDPEAPWESVAWVLLKMGWLVVAHGTTPAGTRQAIAVRGTPHAVAGRDGLVSYVAVRSPLGVMHVNALTPSGARRTYLDMGGEALAYLVQHGWDDGAARPILVIISAWDGQEASGDGNHG